MLKMVYYEQAYIRHYERNNKKEKRKIKTVEVRGIKTNSKFKDNEQIILISRNEFNQMQENQQQEINKLQNEINQLQETNKELTNELNQNDNNKNHETNQLYFKLIALMEMINNRNELLLNANDNLNYVIDNIIKELRQQFINLINDNGKENKKNLETFLKSVFDNANDNQIILKNDVSRIEQELNEANEQINNLSWWQLLRKRKQIKIDIDLTNLKELQGNLINYNGLDINIASDNILTEPNFNNLDLMEIKGNAKNKIDFQNLYINLENEK